MNTVNKGIKFNLDNPDHKAMFEHAMKRQPFSEYIRRLIYKDMSQIIKPIPDTKVDVKSFFGRG